MQPRRVWRPTFNGWLGLILTLPIISLLGMLVIYPLVRVFLQASSGPDPVVRYVEVFTNNVSRRALITTLSDSLVVTLVTVVLALAIAWTLHSTQRRWVRTVLWTATLIPMWIGVIMKNYAIFILFSRQGPLNGLMVELGILGEPISLLYSDFAVIVGISYSLIPYAVFSLYTAIAAVDLHTLRAAQSLGAMRTQALLGVALPAARNGIAASAALVFVLSIGFYITPIMLGGPQTAFMATYISQQLNSRYDFEGAAASAAVLLLIATAVLGTVIAIVGSKTLRKAIR